MTTLITAANETMICLELLRLLTIIFVIYTCLLIPEKCALYDSFLSAHCVARVNPLKKIGEKKTAQGEVLGL